MPRHGSHAYCRAQYTASKVIGPERSYRGPLAAGAAPSRVSASHLATSVAWRAGRSNKARVRFGEASRGRGGGGAARCHLPVRCWRADKRYDCSKARHQSASEWSDSAVGQLARYTAQNTGQIEPTGLGAGFSKHTPPFATGAAVGVFRHGMLCQQQIASSPPGKGGGRKRRRSRSASSSARLGRMAPAAARAGWSRLYMSGAARGDQPRALRRPAHGAPTRKLGMRRFAPSRHSLSHQRCGQPHLRQRQPSCMSCRCGSRPSAKPRNQWRSPISPRPRPQRPRRADHALRRPRHP